MPNGWEYPPTLLADERGHVFGGVQHIQHNGSVSTSLNLSDADSSHSSSMKGSSSETLHTIFDSESPSSTPSISRYLGEMRSLQVYELREKLEQIIASEMLRCQATSLRGDDAVILIDLLQEVDALCFAPTRLYVFTLPIVLNKVFGTHTELQRDAPSASRYVLYLRGASFDVLVTRRPCELEAIYCPRRRSNHI